MDESNTITVPSEPCEIVKFLRSMIEDPETWVESFNFNRDSDGKTSINIELRENREVLIDNKSITNNPFSQEIPDDNETFEECRERTKRFLESHK
jgi:hypothetical protein